MVASVLKKETQEKLKKAIETYLFKGKFNSKGDGKTSEEIYEFLLDMYSEFKHLSLEDVQTFLMYNLSEGDKSPIVRYGSPSKGFGYYYSLDQAKAIKKRYNENYTFKDFLNNSI